VLDTVKDFTPSLQSATFLLSIIVETSEGSLNPENEKNLKAHALLEEHPELIGRLETAWEEKSFKDIRNLSKSSPVPFYVYHILTTA
jgi:hypothetical protein